MFTWTGEGGREHTGHPCCKIIGPRQIDPLFTTNEASPDWEINSQALTGYTPAGV
jgi:hypothetical protein